jgi:predicted HAD superfamily Cof-like phosphohydrolase
MSRDWNKDMNEMHHKFGVHEAVSKMDANKLSEFLEFRIKCLQEELDELKAARNGDDAVDALIDLTVFAIGTLDLFGVEAYMAWDRVYKANITKEIGIKESRPNPLGLPDLVKPEGWTAPTHIDNVGVFEKIYD